VFGSFVGDGPVDVQTQSSAIDLSGVSGALTTFSESGHTPERLVTGSIEKRRVAGAIGSGGPVVRLASRSGSIRIR
jgi:hypothetical protein